jgi:opine dehydrogenase
VSPSAVVVCGGSDTAVTAAACLALAGHEVVLFEHPVIGAATVPLAEQWPVRVSGVGCAGASSGGVVRGGATGGCVFGSAAGSLTTIARVTDDPFAAFAPGNILLAFVPVSAQAAFGELLLPLMEPRHVFVLLPGSLGCLAYAHWLLQRGRRPESLPTFVESDMAPFVVRREAMDHVRVLATVTRLGIGAFPAERTASAEAVMAALFPGAWAYPHVLAVGLGALDTVLRPATGLLNVARVERAHGGEYLYEDGVTPGVAQVIEALDGERRAIAAAVGLQTPSVAEALATAGLGPVGDLWATINGSFALSQQQCPGSPQAAWLTQDVPFGLRTWVELAGGLNVGVPVARSLVALADTVTGIDSWRDGRSLEDLGIDGLSVAQLQRYLDTGSPE